MKSIFVFVISFFAATSIWACDYTISLDLKFGDTKICVDGVQFKQLKENYYQVTFANYFPGTKISYQKVNFFFNGKKEFIEQDIMTLDKVLRTQDIGNLYFSYETGFVLISDQAKAADLKPLMDEINSLVH